MSLTLQSQSPIPPAQAVGAAHHIPSLDGLRGLAILLVMLFHMTLLGTLPGSMDLNFHCAFDRLWFNIMEFGWCGVDLFFVLSGFLITGLLYDAKGGARYFSSFYVRRVLRIFPLYYLVVAFSLLVLPHIHNSKTQKFGHIAGDEIWYWTYLSNYIIAKKHFRHGILDVSWTLAIEEQFYLVWPAVVLLLSRVKLLWVCVGMIVSAIIVRTILFAHGVHPIAIMALTPCRMDSLAVGAALAMLVRGPGGVDRWIFPAKIVGFISGLFLAVHWIVKGPSWDDSTFGQDLGYSLLAIFFGSVLCLSLRLKPRSFPNQLLNSTFMRQMGRYSYALYLCNFPIRALIRDGVYGPSRFLTVFGSQMPGQLVFYGLAMSGSVIVAWLSWHLYEVHFLRLKRFFPMPHASAAK
jgi:peptidoglycan/LPS O-acetylase OafA/YrhL